MRVVTTVLWRVNCRLQFTSEFTLIYTYLYMTLIALIYHVVQAKVPVCRIQCVPLLIAWNSSCDLVLNLHVFSKSGVWLWLWVECAWTYLAGLSKPLFHFMWLLFVLTRVWRRWVTFCLTGFMSTRNNGDVSSRQIWVYETLFISAVFVSIRGKTYMNYSICVCVRTFPCFLLASMFSVISVIEKLHRQQGRCSRRVSSAAAPNGRIEEGWKWAGKWT